MVVIGVIRNNIYCVYINTNQGSFYFGDKNQSTNPSSFLKLLISIKSNDLRLNVTGLGQIPVKSIKPDNLILNRNNKLLFKTV